MAAFGFSVGDVISGLRVIYVSCEALRDASSAHREYTALRSEVESLLHALESIADLALEENGTEKQRSAIKASVASCKACIDDFLASAAKYEPHLRQGGVKHGWAAGYRRIKWALCKKEDVMQFRAQLECHSSCINMLLITFQAQSQMAANRHVAVRTEEDIMTALLQGLSVEQRQCFKLLMSQNHQLQRRLDDVRQLLHLQGAIPPQVILQRPVILLDAFGKVAPFHLDFIDSLDAFVAVLKIRSEQAGVQDGGLQKLDKKEFCIRDTPRRRNLDLSRPWATVFRPGQNVDMSMVFRRRLAPTTCPDCCCQNAPCEEDGEVECDFCGLWYHHVREQSEVKEASPQHVDHHIQGTAPSIGDPSSQVPNFDGFRRVRIIAMVVNTPALAGTPPVLRRRPDQPLESVDAELSHLFGVSNGQNGNSTSTNTRPLLSPKVLNLKTANRDPPATGGMYCMRNEKARPMSKKTGSPETRVQLPSPTSQPEQQDSLKRYSSQSYSGSGVIKQDLNGTLPCDASIHCPLPDWRG
ncbi:hypothetical protein LOZ41_006009, partial [Ophidiomyces ophidiicola]